MKDSYIFNLVHPNSSARQMIHRSRASPSVLQNRPDPVNPLVPVTPPARQR